MNWSREELIMTLALYFQLPFGRLNHTTPEVINLAQIIGRSANAVAMRLSNFAACDPYILNSGRHGLNGGISVCRPIWDEFANDRENLFSEAKNIEINYLHLTVEDVIGINDNDLVGLDVQAVVKRRINQNVFRTMILNNYRQQCAISGINIPSLLVASHIIPWAAEPQHRLDPENGICLSPLYDKAFDKGLIGITPEYEIILSNSLHSHIADEYYDRYFASIEHTQIVLPEEHAPNPSFLQYHLNNIFDH